MTHVRSSSSAGTVDGQGRLSHELVALRAQFESSAQGAEAAVEAVVALRTEAHSLRGSLLHEEKKAEVAERAAQDAEFAAESTNAWSAAYVSQARLTERHVIKKETWAELQVRLADAECHNNFAMSETHRVEHEAEQAIASGHAVTEACLQLTTETQNKLLASKGIISACEVATRTWLTQANTHNHSHACQLARARTYRSERWEKEVAAARQQSLDSVAGIREIDEQTVQANVAREMHESEIDLIKARSASLCEEVSVNRDELAMMSDAVSTVRELDKLQAELAVLGSTEKTLCAERNAEVTTAEERRAKLAECRYISQESEDMCTQVEALGEQLCREGSERDAWRRCVEEREVNVQSVGPGGLPPAPVGWRQPRGLVPPSRPVATPPTDGKGAGDLSRRRPPRPTSQQRTQRGRQAADPESTSRN